MIKLIVMIFAFLLSGCSISLDDKISINDDGEIHFSRIINTKQEWDNNIKITLSEKMEEIINYEINKFLRTDSYYSSFKVIGRNPEKYRVEIRVKNKDKFNILINKLNNLKEEDKNKLFSLYSLIMMPVGDMSDNEKFKSLIAEIDEIDPSNINYEVVFDRVISALSEMNETSKEFMLENGFKKFKDNETKSMIESLLISNYSFEEKTNDERSLELNEFNSKANSIKIEISSNYITFCNGSDKTNNTCHWNYPDMESIKNLNVVFDYKRNTLGESATILLDFIKSTVDDALN